MLVKAAVSDNVYLKKKKKGISECSHKKLDHLKPYRSSLAKLIKKVEQKFNYFIRQTSMKTRSNT